MSNLYNLTQKIHEILPKINQKFGLKIEIIGNWQIHPQKGLFLVTEKMEVMDKENWQKFLDECCLAIQSPQIHQILVSLQDVFGENPEILIFKKQIEKDNNQVKQLENKNEWAKVYKTHKEGLEIILNLTPQSQAEAFYKRWCYGFPTSLFDQDPILVLTELVEILENLLK